MTMRIEVAKDHQGFTLSVIDGDSICLQVTPERIGDCSIMLTGEIESQLRTLSPEEQKQVCNAVYDYHRPLEIRTIIYFHDGDTRDLMPLGYAAPTTGNTLDHSGWPADVRACIVGTAEHARSPMHRSVADHSAE